MNNGQCTMDNAQWAMDNGQWTIISAFRHLPIKRHPERRRSRSRRIFAPNNCSAPGKCVDSSTRQRLAQNDALTILRLYFRHWYRRGRIFPSLGRRNAAPTFQSSAEPTPQLSIINYQLSIGKKIVTPVCATPRNDRGWGRNHSPLSQLPLTASPQREAFDAHSITNIPLNSIADFDGFLNCFFPAEQINRKFTAFMRIFHCPRRKNVL